MCVCFNILAIYINHYAVKGFSMIFCWPKNIVVKGEVVLVTSSAYVCMCINIRVPYNRRRKRKLNERYYLLKEYDLTVVYVRQDSEPVLERTMRLNTLFKQITAISGINIFGSNAFLFYSTPILIYTYIMWVKQDVSSFRFRHHFWKTLRARVRSHTNIRFSFILAQNGYCFMPRQQLVWPFSPSPIHTSFHGKHRWTWQLSQIVCRLQHRRRTR